MSSDLLPRELDKLRQSLAAEPWPELERLLDQTERLTTSNDRRGYALSALLDAPGVRLPNWAILLVNDALGYPPLPDRGVPGFEVEYGVEFADGTVRYGGYDRARSEALAARLTRRRPDGGPYQIVKRTRQVAPGPWVEVPR